MGRAERLSEMFSHPKNNTPVSRGAIRNPKPVSHQVQGVGRSPLVQVSVYLSQARLLLERVLRTSRIRPDAHELRSLADALGAAAFLLQRK
jgi:hypothetical protein